MARTAPVLESLEAPPLKRGVGVLSGPDGELGNLGCKVALRRPRHEAARILEGGL
jgi:hypothetical protein